MSVPIFAFSAQDFGGNCRSGRPLLVGFLTLFASWGVMLWVLLASWRGTRTLRTNAIGSRRQHDCAFKNGIKSQGRLSSMTIFRKIVIVVVWAAFSMPCFAHDSSGLLPTDVPSTFNEPPMSPLPLYNHPYLVICTVDGNILVLNAMDGGLVCVFNSGIPLVGPSEPLSDQDRRIVPGLDGRLYVSSGGEDGLLEPLEITVLDVLANPVKTCKSTPSEDGMRETECGIVTATKSTSLFALDPTTGNLVWQQHPNGTTKAGPTSAPVSHTVLLQRENVLVQQISTDTGKTVWNITLGSLQALEFGKGAGSSASSGGLPPPAHSMLPGAGSMGDHAENLLLEDYLYELPHVVFSEDGTNVVAIDPSTSTTNNRRRLWSRDFPTVVASVFGLNGKSWEPLTVLDEGEPDARLGDEPARRFLPEPTTGLTLYRAPRTNVFAPFNVEKFYKGFNWLIENTAWKYQNQYKWSLLPLGLVTPPLQSRHQQEPETSADAGNIHLFHDRLYSPWLELPSPEPLNQSRAHSGGLFLTWPFLVSLVVCFSIGAILGFRYLYMKKKKRWLGLLRAAVTSGGRTVAFQKVGTVHHDIGHHRRSGSDGSNNTLTEKKNANSLIRSQSLPGKLHHDVVGDIAAHILQTPAYVFQNMPILALPNSVTPHKSGLQGGSLAIIEKPPSATRTTTTSTEISSSQGVGLIDGSIPLIQYSRYASEFEELGALGKGGFGSVLQCRNALDGREYAIKKVHIRSDSNLPQAEFSRRLQRTLREVKSLALLDHPNIVRYYTAWLEQEQRDATNESHSGAPDSEYGIMSPSESRCETLGGVRKNETSQRMRVERSLSNGGHRRPSIEYHWKNNYTNPLGYAHPSLGVGDSVSSSGYDARDIHGVPDALDDYGFVFDRGDEEEADCAGDSERESKTADASERRNSTAGGSRHRGICFQSSESTCDDSLTGWSRESRNQSEATREEIQDEEGKKIPASQKSSTTTKYILYIQMQFCSQKTLADFLSNEEARKGPSGSITGVDIPYALNLFLQVAQGVKHVHDQGLIHRDLKPNNCFVDDAGVVKVGDFGLSRESSDSGRSDEPVLNSSTVFENGEITAGVGTRAYASPEQMKGGSEYDSSTDIYSLGIILFELCYPMYTGMERNIVLSNLRNHTFPDLWTEIVVRDFPTLHSLLLSMVSNHPSSRPTAASVVHNIESILEGFTISSLDKQHYEDCILLRVETKPREDVLRHTMQLVRDAASPDSIEIVQYGLRGGTNKAIMEFAIRPCEKSQENEESRTGCCLTRLGNLLVSRLSEDPEVLLIRQVSATKYT